MKCLLVSFAFCCLSGCFSHLSAQIDYVVTAKGDTVKGDVKLLLADLVDQVQVKVNKKKKVYTAVEALTVAYAGVLYKTVKYDNRFKYMTVLKSGFLSLYGFRLPQQTNYDGRYLQMRDGRGMEVPNLTFKRSLAKFLEDCPSVSERVRNGDFNRGEIEKIIDEYNTCLQFKTNKTTGEIPISQKVISDTNAVDDFLKRVQDSPDFPNKKDAVDLLKDLSGKIYRSEILPNYLIKELRASLKDQPSFADELEKILANAKKSIN